MPGYNPGVSSMSVEGNDMETAPNRFVESWLGHIRALSEEIGPRGSTTEGERKGSEYCAQVMRQLGMRPRSSLLPAPARSTGLTSWRR